MTLEVEMQDYSDSAPVIAEERGVEPAEDTDVAMSGDRSQALPAAEPAPAEPAQPSFVYALGRIEPRFPSLSLEKEFAQAGARQDTNGLTDRQVFRAVVSDPANRYLARHLCWLLVIEGLETYVLLPRDPADYGMLVDAYRDYPSGDDVDLVIGIRAQIAPSDMCNGLALPIVVFDQLYSFDRQTLLEAIPRPHAIPEKDDAAFRQTSAGVFAEIRQIADNAGATDEHRALNYLSVRHPAIYGKAAEMKDSNSSLTGVEVRLSPLSGARKVVDVVFAYTHRQTDVTERFGVRVDVTEQYPFLVTPLSPSFVF